MGHFYPSPLFVGTTHSLGLGKMGSNWVGFSLALIYWCHTTSHHNTQYNDILQNDIQHKDAQYKVLICDTQNK